MGYAGEDRYVVATDVGGTCTDTIVFKAGEPLVLGKALSTPPNFATGVIDSIRSAADSMNTSLEDLLGGASLFMHGSTVVDNTLLTRGGARTGLITTEGFEDTLLITRGAYGRWGGLTEDRIKHPVATDRAAPLVPKERIQGVPERVDWKGAEIRELDEDAVRRAIKHLVDAQKVDAIAVCFLWSFYNDAHETRVRALIQEIAPDVYVSLSSEIAPVPGEYERTSTTVINAYAGGIARDYVNNLQALLSGFGYGGPLLVMQGYGGLLPAEEAADRAVGMIECGPAAGVIGSRYLGQIMEDRDIIAADMGGTTFKVGVIQDGELEYAREPMVDRFHYMANKIEVVSIGAGGGSIVSLDPRTNVPRVGPQSAGAKPGPICYGQGGTEPTLTDVMLLVGYMSPEYFLSGTIPLDTENTRRIFKETIADPLGLSVAQAAIGIYRVAAAQIADLIREITVERGLDPREFVLHAFGGSCPLLCGVFGEELGVKRIIVPYTASVNCAFGLVAADIVHAYSATKTLPVPSPAAAIEEIFQPMVEQAKAQLTAEGFAPEDITLDASVDLRYGRQVHEVTTPLRGGLPLEENTPQALVDDFEALYERKFGKGSAYRAAGIEMTMFRLNARGQVEKPEVAPLPLGAADASAARIGTRDIFVEAKGDLAPGAIYDFEALTPGNVIEGPAVIHTPITTIVLQDGQTGTLDPYRNLAITLGQ